MKFSHYRVFSQKTTALIVAIFVLFVFVILLLGVLPATRVGAGNDHNISGFAWSDNIGWISFNCLDTSSCDDVDYGVSVDGGSGVVSGFAWSDNIGWVSFNENDTRFCPTEPCVATFDGEQLSGWARALSFGGGWDGWIHLSDLDPSYGVTFENEKFGGYAWGSDVVGWTLFNLTINVFEEPSVTECADTLDNDGDGRIDAEDPGCWTNPTVPSSYNPLDNDEFNVIPPTVSAFPNVFIEGESTTISWECFDSTSSSGVNFATNGTVSGSATDSPLDDTIYTVVCSNGGEASAGVDVLHPELLIEANPSLIRQHTSSTISWSATNVESCTVSGPDGLFGEGVEGSQTTGALLERSVYTLTCQNTNGTTVQESVLVNVTPEFGEI